jgi:hypothetical protein
MVRIHADRGIGAELREPGEARLPRSSCIGESLLDLLHGPIHREGVTVQEPDLRAFHREPCYVPESAPVRPRHHRPYSRGPTATRWAEKRCINRRPREASLTPIRSRRLFLAPAGIARRKRLAARPSWISL